MTPRQIYTTEQLADLLHVYAPDYDKPGPNAADIKRAIRLVRRIERERGVSIFFKSGNRLLTSDALLRNAMPELFPEISTKQADLVRRIKDLESRVRALESEVLGDM